MNTICTINGIGYDLSPILETIESQHGECKRTDIMKDVRILISGISFTDAKELVDKIFETGIVPETYSLRNDWGQCGQNYNKVQPHLISCSACGKQISNQASACPNCGQPTGVHVCPRCGSADTKPISGASKAVSVGLFGVFAANKVVSKYCCRKCGHKW